MPDLGVRLQLLIGGQVPLPAPYAVMDSFVSLEARNTDRGRDTFLSSWKEKYPKESTPRGRANNFLRSSGFGSTPCDGTSLSRRTVTHSSMCVPLRAFPKTFRCSECAARGWNC